MIILSMNEFMCIHLYSFIPINNVGTVYFYITLIAIKLKIILFIKSAFNGFYLIQLLCVTVVVLMAKQKQCKNLMSKKKTNNQSLMM